VMIWILPLSPGRMLVTGHWCKLR